MRLRDLIFWGGVAAFTLPASIALIVGAEIVDRVRGKSG